MSEVNLNGYKGASDEKALCYHCNGNLRKAATYIHINACTHTYDHTPCWHLSVATFSPQTFPLTDCQASVSTSGCFLRPVFLWKDTEGLSQAGGTYISYFRLRLLQDTWNSTSQQLSSCHRSTLFVLRQFSFWSETIDLSSQRKVIIVLNFQLVFILF